MKRRSCTARVRRSSGGASSRNAYGLALRISCASGDGAAASRATHSDLARLDAREQRLEAVDVHRLVQAVVHRLLHERMIRDLAIAARRGSPAQAS